MFRKISMDVKIYAFLLELSDRLRKVRLGAGAIPVGLDGRAPLPDQLPVLGPGRGSQAEYLCEVLPYHGGPPRK